MPRVKNDNALVPIRYALPALHELESLGHSRSEIFAQADIHIAADLIASDDLSLPLIEFNRLYALVLSLLEIQTRDHSARQKNDKERLEIMCCVAIACPDLRCAIDRVATFCRLGSPVTFSLNLEESAGLARLEMKLHRSGSDTATFIVNLASMYFFHQLFSWITGQRLLLSGLLFSAAEPKEPIAAASLFDCVPRFDQSSDAIVFNADCLNLPVIRTYADLLTIIDYLPFDMLHSGSAGLSLTARVRAMLISALQKELPLMPASAVSQVLHMSEAGLRRRLREENTSYADIKNSCQYELAEHFLHSTDMPIVEIASRIGFSDDRAFRRAFRRWSNLSPSEYRDDKGHRYQHKPN
jgi:AraC-like DNA-binding protein